MRYKANHQPTSPGRIGIQPTRALLAPTATGKIRNLIIVLSIVSAWLSWHLFEKHFMNLKRYFEYVKPAVDEKQPAPCLKGRGLAVEG